MMLFCQHNMILERDGSYGFHLFMFNRDRKIDVYISLRFILGLVQNLSLEIFFFNLGHFSAS